jgi:hypothetical protein
VRIRDQKEKAEDQELRKVKQKQLPTTWKISSSESQVLHSIENQSKLDSTLVERLYIFFIVGVSRKIDSDFLYRLSLFPRAGATSILIALSLDSSTRGF